MLQQQLFYDYTGRGHTSEFGDTSSTETLGPPHNQSDTRLPLTDREEKLSASTATNNMTASRREKLKVPLSLPQDLTRGGAQRLLKGRISRLSVKTFLRVFFVAFIFVVFVLTCLVILIFESETGLLQGVRSTQEMMLLRLQYYQPIKEHIKCWLGIKP